MPYKPRHAIIETTFKCNVNCIHCGSDCGFEERQDEMSTAEILDLIDQLAELGNERIYLSGGEPFLKRDWAVISQRIKSKNIELCYISNGYIINPEMIKILVELKPHVVGFSIDGGDAELHDYIRGKEGCFDRLMNAFNLCLDAGINTYAITTLQRINFHHLEKIRDLLLLKGVDGWQIQAGTPMGRMDKRTALTERQFYETAGFIVYNDRRYKRFHISGADCFGYFDKLHSYLHPKGWGGCQAGLQGVGIESNGNVKGCLSLPGKTFIEGNIKEKSLKDIWNGKQAFSYNRQFSKDLLKGYCRECAYGSLCRGGCTERSFGFTGEFCENPLCLYKVEQKGFSSQKQGSLHPDPEEIVEIYNKIRPLPKNLKHTLLDLSYSQEKTAF